MKARTWVPTHACRNTIRSNDAPSAYVWYKTTGQPLPTECSASVATRPLRSDSLWNCPDVSEIGWSNDTSFQLELEHRYSKGYAFQVFYVMSNAMRVAGDGWR